MNNGMVLNSTFYYSKIQIQWRQLKTSEQIFPEPFLLIIVLIAVKNSVGV